MKKTKSKSEQPELRILKISNCASLSGRSILTYHIGCDEKETDPSGIFFRIYENSGKGLFSDDWVSIQQIRETFGMGSPEAIITSTLMNSIFGGKSVNTAGFLIAVLKEEGVISVAEDKRRRYEECDPAKFSEGMAALIQSFESLKIAKAPTLSLKVNKKSISKGVENPA